MHSIMSNRNLFAFLIALFFISINPSDYLNAQEDEELILYYQMEPLDDSLFILIQEELFIDPPDPKAEIVVDVRDPNNQTISIKGTLYPFLALQPETRARVITYPFKLNLQETIHYASVFTRVIEKMRFKKILDPPTVYQISPGLGYVNPFLQLMGGERFGIPIKSDVGISMGMGTPYSGALETNFIEVNFHLLGFKGGFYSSADIFVEQKSSNNHNNLFVTEGFQVAYVIPFGNFFEVSYTSSTEDFSETQIRKFTINTVNKDNIVRNPDGSIKFQPYLFEGSSVNWELRYPFKLLGSTRGKFYVAQFLEEWHIGFFGREMALAGSVFDLRIDAMFNSPVRQTAFVVDVIVQKIFESWAFSSVALGPSVIVSRVKSGGWGFTSIFANLRLKLGTSL